jgi:hypothetical protein
MGCSTCPRNGKLTSELRDGKVRVLSLKIGMSRQQVEAIVTPIPNWPSYDLSISGIVVKEYAVEPDVHVQIEYGPNWQLIRIPDRLIVKCDNGSGGKKVALVDIK